MEVLIDERHLPAMLTTGPMTDEEFAELCAGHEDLLFEMTADGELIAMAMPCNLTALREQEVYNQLLQWSQGDRKGIAGAANMSFVLPSGARRAPDAAWFEKSKVAHLPGNELNKYWRLCPDFVIELRSSTDKLPPLRSKMEECIRNGAQLGWLIDPERRVVEIYRPGSGVSIVTPVDTLAGEPPVSQFVLHLGPVWDPLSQL